MLWALADPLEDELLVVEYPYFKVTCGTAFSEATTYVEHDDPVASPDIVCFNHGLGEILTADADAGLVFRSLEEHQSAPWNPLGTAMVDIGDGEYALREQPERLAATYTLQTTKPR